MPPRAQQIHDINERTFSQWYFSLPIVTRSLLTCYLITGLALFAKVLPVLHMLHSWREVFQLPIPQVWRPITNFMIIGGPSINFLFQLVWLIQYGASYETAKFMGNAADAITMLLFGMASILALDTFLPFIFYSPVHGPSLIFMMLYLWSKHNPNSQVAFFGVIKFQALYLPFALLALDVVQGASPISGIIGILAGHMYYFLTEVYPRTSGRNVIVTPTWLARLVYRYLPGSVPAAQVNAPHPSDTGFRAFSGAGRRLAD